MNNGGSDMATVKDAPDMKDAMKKINATYGMKKEKKILNDTLKFDKLLQLDKGQWDMLMQHIIKQEKILGGNDEQSNAD